MPAMPQPRCAFQCSCVSVGAPKNACRQLTVVAFLHRVFSSTLTVARRIAVAAVSEQPLRTVTNCILPCMLQVLNVVCFV